MKCNGCTAVMPFLEDMPQGFDCVFCEGKQFPDATDILTEPSLGFVNETRHGQITMAGEITDSIESTVPTLFEAGTGVGKSFAYLLPAILSGKRTIVSTAKITLQQQLIEKDLPRIQQYLAQLGHPKAGFSYAPAYGKNKYACYAECEKEKGNNGKEWAKYTKFFQKSDYGLWEDADKLHLRLDNRLNANDCNGPDCRHYKTCGYIKARQVMLRADVVVANNWLLGYHYKLRHVMPHFYLLGEFSHVVVDEAHKIEDGIRTAFTNETSLNALDKLQYRFDKLLEVANEQFDLPELVSLDPLWKAGFAALFSLNKAQSNVLNATTTSIIQGLVTGLDDVSNRLLDKATLDIMFGQLSVATHTELISRWITKTLNSTPASGALHTITAVGMPARSGFPNVFEDQCVFLALEKMLGLIEDSRETFSNILQAPPNRTWTLEQKTFNGKVDLIIKDMPVNIGGYMPDKSVTYVSATLALDNNFDVFADRVGLRGKNYKSDIFSSPFNLRKQAYLYVPPVKDVPEPVTTGDTVEIYREAMASQIYELILACEGDTFVLFTSNAEQVYVKNYLVSRGYPHPVIDQMTYPNDALARYRATPKATLLGSKSFWEGVDVAGNKLFMVIITKLPFPQRSDPIIKARHDAFKGENPFPFVDLPEMLFDLRQGAGRLIRTQKDRGMLVVLDTRLRTKSYKQRAINALGLTPVDNLAMVCKGLRERNG